jgi:hypothetical protein
MVLFGVNQPSGTWSLREHAHGHWTDLQAPTSSAYLERAPSNNLLTVIMRGDEYALLINYHFVGVYHSSALSDGPVGVFASDGTVTCTGADLSVFRNITS